jgi:hypothetical protein
MSETELSGPGLDRLSYEEVDLPAEPDLLSIRPEIEVSSSGWKR